MSPRVTKLKLKPDVVHESAHQATVIGWADSAAGKGRWPELELIFAIGNYGGRHNYATYAWRLSQGLRPGMPDLMLPVARGGFHGLFIEMKREHHRTTPKRLEMQRTKREALQAQGYQVAQYETAREAIELLTLYMAQGN